MCHYTGHLAITPALCRVLLSPSRVGCACAMMRDHARIQLEKCGNQATRLLIIRSSGEVGASLHEWADTLPPRLARLQLEKRGNQAARLLIIVYLAYLGR